MIPKEARTKRDKQLFDAPDAKPPYRVPSMGEIAEVPWNGLTVVSTFAGAGGSSLGYRMAGFRVLWANEFVPAAQESYRANMRDGTVLDGRDIRKVTAASILGALGLEAGEIDVLDGSPPCQAFSTAGKREKGWGHEREYAHGATQKNEELFTDFIRLRDGLMPRAFVAENVSGLVKGAAKGFFLNILAELKRGYRVEARVLDAQWLGVPQQRQRVIFVGVRDDLGLDPAFPSPLPWRYSVRDALPWLGGASVAQGNKNGHSSARGECVSLASPSPTVIATGASGQFDVREDRVIQKSRYDAEIDVTNAPALTVRSSDGSKAGKEITVVKNKNAAFSGKGARFDGDEVAPTVMSRRVNFELEQRVVHDPGRGNSPPIDVADISGNAIGAEWDKLNPGQQSEKYFSLVKPAMGDPCPTITAAGGQNSGIACVVHPTEKRKFTILELKRICAWPDDAVLTGSYAAQWERLGNSVPPIMMLYVAAALRDRVLLPALGRGRSKATRRAAGTPRAASPRASKDAGASRAARSRQRAKVAPSDGA